MRFQIGFTAERLRIFSTVNKLKIAALTSRMASKIVFLFQTKPINLTIVIRGSPDYVVNPFWENLSHKTRDFRTISSAVLICVNLYDTIIHIWNPPANGKWKREKKTFDLQFFKYYTIMIMIIIIFIIIITSIIIVIHYCHHCYCLDYQV